MKHHANMVQREEEEGGARAHKKGAGTHALGNLEQNVKKQRTPPLPREAYSKQSVCAAQSGPGNSCPCCSTRSRNAPHQGIIQKKMTRRTTLTIASDTLNDALYVDFILKPTPDTIHRWRKQAVPVGYTRWCGGALAQTRSPPAHRSYGLHTGRREAVRGNQVSSLPTRQGWQDNKGEGQQQQQHHRQKQQKH